MNNPDYVLGLAVFTVKEEFINQMPAITAAYREALNGFSGLVSLETVSPMGESKTFSHIAKWDTMESAKVVADAFENGDERFMPLMQASEELNFMGYFQP